MKTKRLDRDGEHRKQFERAKKTIYATQSVCGICGKPVDFNYKHPHPLSPCVDHIVPLALGGHPSDIDNLQLAHADCNKRKSDKYLGSSGDFKDRREGAAIRSNRMLPLSRDWGTPLPQGGDSLENK